jgi:predicted RNA binding protein YcfA (HicA-like mRNA interferase family)
MKLPRDLDGIELVKLLEDVGYYFHHQTGSYMIIRTIEPSEHSVTVPNHKPLKVGTLNAILNDVADHLGIDKKDLVRQLFG